MTGNVKPARMEGLKFTCSNGWRFVIFNDCDEVTAPDRRSIDFDTLRDTMPELREYYPPDLAREHWGLPSP